MTHSPRTAADLLTEGFLFTQEDRQRFEGLETQVVTLVDRSPPHKHGAAQATLFSLREQAAWLFIEQQFSDHPTLEGLSIDLYEEGPDSYVLVQTLREDEEAFNELGQDPEQLDEQIQMYLNDMGRKNHRAFFQALGKAEIYCDELETASKQVLGEPWAAKRKEHHLTKVLEPQADRKVPRM